MTLKPTRRALALLRLGYPNLAEEDIAQLSFGSRNALLLRLRKALFGSVFESTCDCQSCQQKLDLTFDTSMIELQDPKPNKSQSISIEGCQVDFRLPCSQDMLEHELNDSELTATKVLANCIQAIEKDGSSIGVDQVPANFLSQFENQIAELDSQANIEFNVDCPGCGNNQSSRFDILSFLWAEIDSWAKFILREVHVIASCYGWSEETILKMNPVKRNLYLQMVIR